MLDLLNTYGNLITTSGFEEIDFIWQNQKKEENKTFKLAELEECISQFKNIKLDDTNIFEILPYQLPVEKAVARHIRCMVGEDITVTKTLPTMQIQTLNSKALALLDSGANKCFISKSVANALGLFGEMKTTPAGFKISTAANDVEPLGRIDISFRWIGGIVQHPFLILPTENPILIIECDLMQRLRIQPNPVNMSWNFVAPVDTTSYISQTILNQNYPKQLEATCSTTMWNTDTKKFNVIIKIPDIIVTLIEKASVGMTESLILEKILRKFEKILTKEPGRTSVMKHSIILDTDLPLRMPFKSTNPQKREITKQLCMDMKQKGIVSDATGDNGMRIVLVMRPGCDPRLCIDFRPVNEHTIYDLLQMPSIEEILREIGQFEWVTTIDLSKGYWQIELNEKDKPKTAFWSPIGRLMFNVMPFGLVNAPTTFQCLIE
uniref:Reverse transcriptase domain-containing protein n=1 Tax=Strigamia maritima TaxID=126957 RepID=T1IMY5_STRMM